MPVYFSQAFAKQYRAGWFSAAGLLALVSLAAVLILPFVFAYVSNAFWIKNNSYFETPAVSFLNELVVELTVSDSSAATQPVSLVYGTSQAFSAFYADSLRVPTIQTAETDQDGDGVNDMLQFELVWPLKPTETVQGVRAALVFQYQLSSLARLNMQSLALIDVASPIAAPGVNVYGQLELVQQILLTPATPGSVFNLYNVDPINYTTPYTAATIAQQTGRAPAPYVGWNSIVSSYATRSVRTDVAAQPPVWLYGAAQSASQGPQFTLSGRLGYATAHVQYQPSIGEVLKWAWIQYLSVFVVVGVALYYAWWFIFTRRVLDTTVTVDRSLATVLGASGATAGVSSSLRGDGYASVSGLAPGVKAPIF